MSAQDGIPRIYAFLRDFIEYPASGIDFSALRVKLDEAVGEKGLGGEAVPVDKCVEYLAGTVGFLVDARLQEVYQMGSGLAFHS